MHSPRAHEPWSVSTTRRRSAARSTAVGCSDASVRRRSVEGGAGDAPAAADDDDDADADDPPAAASWVIASCVNSTRSLRDARSE